MEKKNISTRVVSLLCAIIFLSTVVFSGCSVKKITKKETEKNNTEDSFKIGAEEEEVTEDSTIVVGDDGQTYVVDNQGNSKPYTPSSSSSGGSSGNSTPKSTPKTTGNSYTPVVNKKSTTKVTPTTASNAVTPKEVYNKLAFQRRFGFNKAYDKMAGLANFFLDSITAYFEYDDKYWLIEFWKGEYAIGAVGCEIGFYTTDVNDVNTYILEHKGPEYLLYGSVRDEDAMKVTMKLWQYETPEQTVPVQKIDYHIDQPHWWAADFQTGRLYKNSDRTSLVMVGSIEFPNSILRNLFINAMKEKGFKEGTINTYHNYDIYQIEGYKVTVGWRNYSDGYQVSK
ncbi:MAG: DUF4474 domain-containing protein [Ruminococcus sp.]|nr:DUF4474 domain-containing protein [Candidatus Copronaster equi]